MAIFCLLFIVCCSLPPSKIYALEPQNWQTLEPNRCVKEYIWGTERIEVATLQGFECIFINVVRVLTPLAGIAVFLTLVVGAFQFITAGGEAKQIQKARKTVTFAVFGLFLFIIIWFILLLIKTITGVDVTKFQMPS